MTERIYMGIKRRIPILQMPLNQHDLIKDTAEGTDKEHKRAFPYKSWLKGFIICFPMLNCIRPLYGYRHNRNCSNKRKKESLSVLRFLQNIVKLLTKE